MGLLGKRRREIELEKINLYKEELISKLDNISDKQLLVEILIELKCINVEIKNIQRNQVIWSD